MNVKGNPKEVIVVLPFNLSLIFFLKLSMSAVIRSFLAIDRLSGERVKVGKT